ncbi:MAG: sulfatase [Planctomycetota bacterium]
MISFPSGKIPPTLWSQLRRRAMLIVTMNVLTLAHAHVWGDDGGEAAQIASVERPNIVLIFADDLGWKDVSFQSDGYFETPNLDRLVSEGMVFSSAYAAAGNCAPSRACLLSGTYTPRHHVYAVGSTDRGPKKSQRLIAIPNRSGLAPANYTLAEAMRDAGYATGHFGKWHLAGNDGALPTVQGFDVSYNSFGNGRLPEGSGGNKPGPTTDPKGVFTLTQEACRFIESNRDQPFFCYLAHHAIHTPLQSQLDTLARFEAKSKASPTKTVSPRYAAMTADLDTSVGRLLDKLDELKLSDNTLLVFTSDNGATNQSPQEPLRGSKGGYYEGGIREPFVARWPGVIPANSRCDVPVINVDLYPTFADVAGASLPPSKVLDGESLRPLFTGGKLQRDSVFWHFPGYLDRPVVRGRPSDVKLGFRTRPVTVIRKGDWKLHLFHEEWQLDGGQQSIETNGSVELYHLATDIGERTNVANANPDKRDELVSEILAWFDTTEALVPSSPNPAFDPNSKKKSRQTKNRKTTTSVIR